MRTTKAHDPEKLQTFRTRSCAKSKSRDRRAIAALIDPACACMVRSHSLLSRLHAAQRQSPAPRIPSMPFSMSKASIPVFEIGLTALSGLLDKGVAYAAAKKIEPTVLLGSRLSPDMFPLVRQVQIAADQAKNGGARLASVE